MTPFRPLGCNRLVCDFPKVQAWISNVWHRNCVPPGIANNENKDYACMAVRPSCMWWEVRRGLSQTRERWRCDSIIGTRDLTLFQGRSNQHTFEKQPKDLRWYMWSSRCEISEWPRDPPSCSLEYSWAMWMQVDDMRKQVGDLTSIKSQTDITTNPNTTVTTKFRSWTDIGHRRVYPV